MSCPSLQLISHEEAQEKMTRGTPGSPGTPEQTYNDGGPLLRARMTPVSHSTPVKASAAAYTKPVRGEPEHC